MLTSIIVPCYNEEKTICLLLEAIERQSVPLETLEVVLADGMSSDGTRRVVADWQAAHPRLAVRVVDNLKRNIPSGLNRAIEAARGEVIVRLDAHSVPAPDYVERCLDALAEGKGENVGGVWEIRPGGTSWIARSIASAAAHPLGVGDAMYRFTTRAAYVDTVPFGSYRRATFDKIGKFDESLLTNEDYELNTRIREAGGRIWLDPRIRSGYFARADLGQLARQYYRYGYWKLRMLRIHPGTLRWRQALPPIFTAGLIGLGILAPFWLVARILLLTVVVVYFVVLLTGTLPISINKKDLSLTGGIPLAIAVMHVSWGWGFLVSLVRK